MNEIRKQRLESALQRELSELIMKRRIKDERLGFVSVTRIKIAPDFSEIGVFVSLFGSDAENKTTWKALLQNANWFKSEASRNLRLRQTPQLQFRQDDSIKEGDRILDKLEEGE